MCETSNAPPRVSLPFCPSCVSVSAEDSMISLLPLKIAWPPISTATRDTGTGKSGLEVARVGNPAWDPQEFGIPQLGQFTKGNVPKGSLLPGPPGRAAQVVQGPEQCLSATMCSGDRFICLHCSYFLSQLCGSKGSMFVMSAVIYGSEGLSV